MKTFCSLISTIVLALLVDGASCHKAILDTSVDAVITGYDQRACLCCGGLMINFENQSQAYIGNYYLADNDGAEWNINAASRFPIYIKVQYQRLDKCGGNYVHLTQLTRK